MEWTEPDLAVGSMDVRALYPSLTHNQAINMTYMAAMESQVRFDNLDYVEISKFINVLTTNQQRVDMQLDQVIPQRTKDRGRKPGLGFLQSDTYKDKEPKWFPPNRSPNILEKKKLWAWSLSLSVKLVLENHYYTKNGITYKQIEGGPIGLDITGELAELIMSF